MSHKLPVTKCKFCGHTFIRRKDESKNECPRCKHCLKCGKRHAKGKKCR